MYSSSLFKLKLKTSKFLLFRLENYPSTLKVLQFQRIELVFQFGERGSLRVREWRQQQRQRQRRQQSENHVNNSGNDVKNNIIVNNTSYNEVNNSNDDVNTNSSNVNNSNNDVNKSENDVINNTGNDINNNSGNDVNNSSSNDVNNNTSNDVNNSDNDVEPTLTCARRAFPGWPPLWQTLAFKLWTSQTHLPDLDPNTCLNCHPPDGLAFWPT